MSQVESSIVDGSFNKTFGSWYAALGTPCDVVNPSTIDSLPIENDDF